MRSAGPAALLALAVSAWAGWAVPGAAAQDADRSEAADLLARGFHQEAAWVAREAGDTARADTILARLDSILRGRPDQVAPLGMDSQGVSYTLRLRYADGVSAIFKVDGSDIFCPSCGANREVAAYRVDHLLGLDLTPLTVPQTVVQNGDTVQGSAMYFIRNAVSPVETERPKPDRLRFFDAVIGNTDRHQGNWLLSSAGRPVAIDHNRAFEYRSTTRPKTCWETEIDSIAAPEDLGAPYERYRTLPADSLAAAVEDVLAPDLVERFVVMRDRVVARIEARIRRPRTLEPARECVWDSSPVG